MTTTWFYGPGVPPLPAPAPSDRPMSEEFRSEMARLAALFVRPGRLGGLQRRIRAARAAPDLGSRRMKQLATHSRGRQRAELAADSLASAAMGRRK